jgi:hypothetical protein
MNDQKTAFLKQFSHMLYGIVAQNASRETYAFRIALNTSLWLINRFELSPQNFSISYGLDNPVLHDLFHTFIQTGIERNPVLHALMCENHLLKAGCKDDKKVTEISKANSLERKVDDFLQQYGFNKTVSNFVRKLKSGESKLAQTVYESLNVPTENASEITSLNILHKDLNQTNLSALVANITAQKIKVVQDMITYLKLTPNDLGLDKNATRDDTVRAMFVWYFDKMSEERRRVLLQVDKLFKKTKQIVKKRALSKKQVSGTEVSFKVNF